MLQYRTWFLDVWSISEMQTLPTPAMLVLTIPREATATWYWNSVQLIYLVCTNIATQPVIVIVIVSNNNNYI